MPDRTDLLRRIDKALATPPQRMSAAYALGLLRETREALADTIAERESLSALVSARDD